MRQRDDKSSRWKSHLVAEKIVSNERSTIMAGKNIAVFGIYRDRDTVERALAILQAARFRNTDISVLFPENEGTKDFAVEKGTKAPEATAAGAGTGAMVGGTLGWLAGIGALAIPGLGPFLAAGPLVGALAGVGAGGGAAVSGVGRFSPRGAFGGGWARRGGGGGGGGGCRCADRDGYA